MIIYSQLDKTPSLRPEMVLRIIFEQNFRKDCFYSNSIFENQGRQKPEVITYYAELNRNRTDLWKTEKQEDWNDKSISLTKIELLGGKKQLYTLKESRF